MMKLNRKMVGDTVRLALKEDVGPLDITTSALVPKNIKISADVITREDGVVSGLEVCEAVFEQLDPDVKFKPQSKDGDPIYKDKVLCYLEGPARAILTGERTALNFLGRMSGIATATKKYADICAPYGVKVMDTRKTTPGLRYLEKHAVVCGGGINHRMGLWDQVLIKDNHLQIMRGLKTSRGKKPALDTVLRDLRKKVQKNTKIEVEVDDLERFQEALGGKPDIIMLDNMAPEDVRHAIEIRRKKAPLLISKCQGIYRLRP
jgi:nicotinate-nucleotide pyrophosphorylase (carboxylating)